jgi:hypothetical protein
MHLLLGVSNTMLEMYELIFECSNFRLMNNGINLRTLLCETFSKNNFDIICTMCSGVKIIY